MQGSDVHFEQTAGSRVEWREAGIDAGATEEAAAAAREITTAWTAETVEEDKL